MSSKPSIQIALALYDRAVRQYESRGGVSSSIPDQWAACENAYLSATEAVDILLEFHGITISPDDPQVHSMRGEGLVTIDNEIANQYIQIKSSLHNCCFHDRSDPKVFKDVFYSVKDFIETIEKLVEEGKGETINDDEYPVTAGEYYAAPYQRERLRRRSAMRRPHDEISDVQRFLHRQHPLDYLPLHQDLGHHYYSKIVVEFNNLSEDINVKYKDLVNKLDSIKNAIDEFKKPFNHILLHRDHERLRRMIGDKYDEDDGDDEDEVRDE